MKKRVSVALVACLLVCATVLPVSAQGPFTTAFAVQNLGSADAIVSVSWYTEEGGLIYTTPEQTIGPGGLGNFLAGDGLPSSWSGSVVVSSTQPISAIANTTDDFGAPRSWGTYEGFSDQQMQIPPTVATEIYVPFALRERSGRSSIIGIQNAGQTTASVNVSFIGHSSSPTNYTLTKSLNAGASTILDLATEVTQLGSAWMGSVVVNSVEPLAGAVMDVGTDLVYSYSAAPSPATNLVLPFVVGSRSNQDTAHALLNPNSTAANVTITYKGEAGGMNVEVTKSKTLQANEMWNWAHVDHTGAGFLGSATVVADAPVLGIVNHTYGSWSAPGKKMSYTMVDASKLTPKISLPFVLRERSNKRQGIIIMNASSTDTTVTVEFKPTLGGAAFTYSKFVPAGGFYNFGTNYPEWNPMLDGAYGTMVVTNSANVNIVAIVNTWNTVVAENVDSLGSYIGTNY